MNDKQFAKLMKQTQQKAEQAAKARKPKGFDPTLDATRSAGDPHTDDTGVEREQMFKEMRRREF
ncbi:MAG: hypothetical protein M3154_09680 [Candidatus Eremiobacteraeota bacterium]|nr:hypothetical protein [Candidatus Eremiobacteraeota bacterium]